MTLSVDIVDHPRSIVSWLQIMTLQTILVLNTECHCLVKDVTTIPMDFAVK